MKEITINQLATIKSLVQNLDNSVYGTCLPKLSGASIGQHIRHIIEFYKCLLQGVSSSEINYDLRTRDKELEINGSRAVKELEDIIQTVTKFSSDTSLILVVNHTLNENSKTRIHTTLFRELAYNLDHCVHHQALIKIALSELVPDLEIDESFGYAPATIRHRKLTCVQ